MAQIHSLADVKSVDIGADTKIWQYSIIFENAKVGNNCNICAHTLIENNVIVGNNVTIKCGVYIWDGSRIEDDVFIGPNATFTNDVMPRSKVYPATYNGVVVKRGASIGANATILPGIVIGQYAMIGAGAVVTTDVPDRAVVVGNPAKIIRYISE